MKIELKAAPQFRPGMSRESFIEALEWASPALAQWAKSHPEQPVDELYFSLKMAVKSVEGPDEN